EKSVRESEKFLRWGKTTSEVPVVPPPKLRPCWDFWDFWDLFQVEVIFCQGRKRETKRMLNRPTRPPDRHARYRAPARRPGGGIMVSFDHARAHHEDDVPSCCPPAAVPEGPTPAGGEGGTGPIFGPPRPA